MFNYSLLVIGVVSWAIFLLTAREINVSEASVSHSVHSGEGGRGQPPGGSAWGGWERGTPLLVLTSSGSHCRGIWKFFDIFLHRQCLPSQMISFAGTYKRRSRGPASC